mgnify:CR=1 FL=1
MGLMDPCEGRIIGNWYYMNGFREGLHRLNPVYEKTGSLARVGTYLRIKRFDIQTEFWPCRLTV